MPKFVANTLKEWKLRCPKGDLNLVFPNGKGKVEDLGNIIHRGLIPAQIASGVVEKNGKAKYTGMHCLTAFLCLLVHQPPTRMVGWDCRPRLCRQGLDILRSP